MTTIEKLWAGVVIAIVIAITGVFTPFTPPSQQGCDVEVDPSCQTGAATPGTRMPHGITVGLPSSSPTNLALYKQGTCSLLANYSIAATSTGQVDCAITGIVSGDVVRLVLAASTTLASQYEIKSATASTTSGFATAMLINFTGVAATPAATNGFGSSTVYQIWRAQ